MFERIRIGTALFKAADILNLEGSTVDRHAVRRYVKPSLQTAANDMKTLKLTGEQAAAAFIINFVQSLHENGELKNIFHQNYDLFRSLFNLYCHFAMKPPTNLIHMLVPNR